MRRLRLGWWANKPPVQRRLVQIGVVVTAALFAFGLCTDGPTWAADHPFAASAVRDMFKLSFLGTLAIAVSEDLRTWSANWRGLRSLVPDVEKACAALVDSVSGVLRRNALKAWAQLDRLPEDIGKLTAWISVVTEPATKHLTTPEQEAPPNPLASWDALRQAFWSAEQPPPRAEVRVPADAVGTAVAATVAALRAMAPCLSTGVQGNVAAVCAVLPTLPSNVAVGSAALDTVRQGGELNREQTSEATFALHAVWAHLHGLRSVLEQASFEVEHGVPYPRRTA